MPTAAWQLSVLHPVVAGAPCCPASQPTQSSTLFRLDRGVLLGVPLRTITHASQAPLMAVAVAESIEPLHTFILRSCSILLASIRWQLTWFRRNLGSICRQDVQGSRVSKSSLWLYNTAKHKMTAKVWHGTPRQQSYPSSVCMPRLTPLRDEYLLFFGFLMLCRCALYVWLCAVWFLLFAMTLPARSEST